MSTLTSGTKAIPTSNANAIRLSNLRIFLHKVESAIQTNRDSGQTWVDRRDLQLLREFEKQLTAPETREQRTRQAPIADDKLTLEVALREAERCRRYPDPVLNEQVIVVLADALHAQKASEPLPRCDCDPDFGCRKLDPAQFICCLDEMEHKAAASSEGSVDV